MSNINYRQFHSKKVTDSASQVLREAAEYFANERVQMTTGDGIKEIMTTGPMFAAYVSKLSEGMDADDAIDFAQLLENTRDHILRESTISDISQVSALSMPMIRKAWPRIGLRNAVPTEAVKAPQFAITFLTPYLVKQDGTKLELPKAMRDPAQQGNILNRKWLDTTPIALPNDSTGVNLINACPGASVLAQDTLDPVFHISQVRMMVDPGTGPILTTVAVNIPLSPDGKLFGQVSATQGAVTVTDIVTGAVNRSTGEFDIVSVRGRVQDVVVYGSVTDESNNHGDSVTFEIRKKEVQIGVGAHINAPLPVEWLQDLMAVYSLDGALKVVDIIANVQAQKVDQEILAFLDTSYLNALAAGTGSYAGSFNVFPAQQYTGSPTEWRNELRTVIDFFATKMKFDSAMHTGSFAIVGNPLDLNLVPNVEWVFTSSQEERAGVEVNFNIGAYSGANRYVLVSSDNVPQGTLRMIFIPGSPDLMTYKYYPYTFNIENGYRDPKKPNVPNIMVSRRDKMEELTPLACHITIQNNNGSLTRTFVG
jgi:hypothetical protein